MEQSKARIISGGSSIFLDAIRICAAFTVLYIHAFEHWFPTKFHNPNKPGELSHFAVVVFFVLSGYVIAHSTISKNRGGMQYAQARLTRLASVVIPALLITFIIQSIIGYINPSAIEIVTSSREHNTLRYLISGLFINEIWFLSAAPSINISLWSLSFEFWYYVIFGLWFFRKPGWKSLIFVAVACLIAGPKILVMMPIWLSGYLAYRLPRPGISFGKAYLFVFLCLFSSLIALGLLPAMPYIIHFKPLYYANQFFTDWIIGIFIAGALWLLPNGRPEHQPSPAEIGFRKIADLTFPLYVLHFPLMLLWQALFGIHFNDITQLWRALVAVVITSAVIGVFLERQRPIWSAMFKKILNIGAGKLTR